MIQQFLRKFFDTSDKDVKALLPLVEQINSREEQVKAMSDEEIKALVPVWRQSITDGMTLDELLPDVFAAVREVSRRMTGMRQFDVQLIGGIVLHQGRISEMKTGEGKTLVAVCPMVLNALDGHGAHLVTVNDYLARRDATWMGPIYNFFGLSLGVIQGQSVDSDELGGSYIYEPGFQHEDPRYSDLRPCTRREAYLCDIVYGTNHEFGFDYLRDNMAFDKDQLVQAELNFAIVDEVDSILIDEARTPHIISGPSGDDVSLYKVVNEVVKRMENEVHWTADKKNHQASLTEEGMDFAEAELQIENLALEPKLFHHINASVKAYALFQRDVDYVVRNGEVIIVDENTGRMMFGRRFSDGLHQALEAKEGVQVQRESQTVATITFQNLFRLYEKLGGMTGTAKTEEDEFRKIYGLDVVCIPTNRPMTRVDQEDVVYKTAEGKWRGICREILRAHTKQQPVLVGTRSIEMSETVSERLTPDALQRLLVQDRLYDMVENEKGLSREAKSMIGDLSELGLFEAKWDLIKTVCGQAGISGDPLDSSHREWFRTKHNIPSDQDSYLQECLEHGIPHNILNAKFHEQEALVISEAGRKGAVTIATNMAGRGVDILLGGRVADQILDRARAEEESGVQSLAEAYGEEGISFRRGGKTRAVPPLPLDDQERRGLAEEVRALGGLYIIGTERHESRRIDNQLRGRAGRQGDPGESRFFVSLEDTLWKIFNAKMLENPLLKGWPALEEVKAGFLTKMILKTQERIEQHFFEARKHVLEYDDVLNTQREHMYGMRREVLLGKDVRDEILQGLDEVVEEEVNNAWRLNDEAVQEFQWDALYEDLNSIFPLVDYATLAELEEIGPGIPLIERIQEIAHEAFKAKEQAISEEVMTMLCQKVMLQSVNDNWMEHLQILEYIREGISLRGYGQVDPLMAYKREAYDLFQTTLRKTRDQMVRLMFRAQLQTREPEVEEGQATAAPAETTEASGPMEWPASVDPKVVGRNDLCPCGSGRKFKQCHYPIFREKGLI